MEGKAFKTSETGVFRKASSFVWENKNLIFLVGSSYWILRQLKISVGEVNNVLVETGNKLNDMLVKVKGYSLLGK